MKRGLGRFMRRAPRQLGPRPQAEPGQAIVLANTREWACSQYEQFDPAPEEWRALYRDFNAEAINDVINERDGQVTCDGIRLEPQRRQGNGHRLYDLRSKRYV